MNKMPWFLVAQKAHRELKQLGYGQIQSALKAAAIEAGVSVSTLRGYLQAFGFVEKVKEHNITLAKALETQTSAAVGVLARWGRRDFKAALHASSRLIEDGLSVRKLMKQEADLRPPLELWQNVVLEKIDDRASWLFDQFRYGSRHWRNFEDACRPEIVNIDLPVPFNQLSDWPEPADGLPRFLGVAHHLPSEHTLGGFWTQFQGRAMWQKDKDENLLHRKKKSSVSDSSRTMRWDDHQKLLLQLEVERIEADDRNGGHALSFGSVFEEENNRIARIREQLTKCIASSTIYSSVMLILPDEQTHHLVASRIPEVIAGEEVDIDLQNDHGKQFLSIFISNEDPIRYKLLIEDFDRPDMRNEPPVLSIRASKSSGLVSVFAPETFFQFLSPYGAFLEFCYIQSGWSDRFKIPSL